MRAPKPLIVGLLLMMGRAAEAQPPPFSISISFDASGTIYEGVVPSFATPTRLYFLMLAMTEPLAGYENGISIGGPDAERWVITRSTPAGVDTDPATDSYVVEIGECVEPEVLPYVINTYDFGYFDGPIGPQDTLVCVGAPTNSAPTIPGHASYRTCTGQIRPSTPQPCSSCLPETPDGCASLNPTMPPGCYYRWCDAVVPTETTSWSHLKSTF